jgi:hypothetical protein
MTESSGLCQVRTEDLAEVASAAFASRTSFLVAVVLDGTTLAGSSGASTLVAGLESLAAATEGQLVRLTGDQPGAMARFARETSAYYRATFEPDPAECDDNPHRVDVRVAREDVIVRTQTRVVLPRRGPRESPGHKPPAIRDLVRSPSPARDVPLRTAAYAAAAARARLGQVVAVVETGDPPAPVRALRPGWPPPRPPPSGSGSTKAGRDGTSRFPIG